MAARDFDGLRTERRGFRQRFERDLTVEQRRGVIGAAVGVVLTVVVFAPAAVSASAGMGASVAPLGVPIPLMLVFRRKYPRWWYDFNLQVGRFGGRVGAYAALQRDELRSRLYSALDEIDARPTVAELAAGAPRDGTPASERPAPPGVAAVPPSQRSITMPLGTFLSEEERRRGGSSTISEHRRERRAHEAND